MPKILVTGGAGYIGSITVERMLERGLEPVVFDNLSDGHAEAVPAGVPFVHADLTDRDAARRVFQKHKIGAVIHLAALALVGESVEQPARYYLHNVGGTMHLLDAMVEHGVKRMVFSSSAATYGEPDVSPITEDCAQAPINPYGQTKLVGERMLADYHRAYGIESVSFRYFNVGGASERCGEDHANETHLIPRILQVALGQRPHVEIYGADYPTPDGTCLRDYLHVADIADAHLTALDRWPGRCRVFNLGNRTGYSVLEVVTAAETVSGKKLPRVNHPRRPGDPPSLVADATRAGRELGWAPRHALRAILESAWQWHSAHPHGYGR